MTRLNDRAFKILYAEVQKCSKNNSLGQLEKKLVLEELEKLRSLSGKPASLEELRKIAIATYPNFSEKALNAAAKANRPANVLSKIIRAALLVGIPVGVVWVANLPYPVIRRPVVQNAPFLLLPSYMFADYHYEQAIASLGQANHLINDATSATDLNLGEVKLKQAREHIDALPVKLIDDLPEYRHWWYEGGLSLNEFQTARNKVADLEAKLFQEKNDRTLFERVDAALNKVKQQYQQATTPADKQKALDSWQASLDELEQVPQASFAGREAQTKLAAYKRDYQIYRQNDTDRAQSSTLIAAAKQFALTAAIASQKPPHPVATWQQVENLWSEAIERLKRISQNDPGYLEAQTLLATYQNNLGVIQMRLQAEDESIKVLKQAKKSIQYLISSTTTNSRLGELQGIIERLETVKPGTTAYQEAQELLLLAQNKLKQLQPKG